MMILVTGGSGFVGRRLCDALLSRNHTVTVVSRDPGRARGAWMSQADMRGKDRIFFRGWLPELDAYDAVINLAGEPLFGKRWDPAVKHELRASRVDATHQIVSAIKVAKDPPDVLINGSAIGYYGSRGDEELPESAAPGNDFLADVCKDWEAAAADCPVRTVFLRTGVVLGRNGGALQSMLLPFKLGVGGPIGNGKAWFSWIHIEDEVGLILHALEGAGDRAPKHEPIHGALNAVSPGVVTNKEYTKALGRTLSRPTILPVPPFGLKLMFGGAAEVLLASQRCVPEVARNTGYKFVYPEIEPALRQILDR
ncbi:MAG: epimerase [Planctomycetota bacterium]|nr:MAG: epimerase [Planctomycetota bacterium]